jgi:DNA-binding NarL/FixJ family response regulator
VTERPPHESLRVVIADDHAFYRAGLVRLLRRSGVDVVADVPNGEAAIRAVEATAPDVAVMDLNMPGVSGVDAIWSLTDLAPATRVLVLTVSAQESDVADAVLAGASGYLLKDGPPEDVLAGIRAAAAGASTISPLIATVLLRRVREASDDGGAALAMREIEVLGLLADGYSVGDVAGILGIEPGAVAHHVSSLILKMQAAHRVRTAGASRNSPSNAGSDAD